MVSNLKSSYEQKSSGWSFLGFGSKKHSVSQKASASIENHAGASSQSTQQGSKNGAQSEFIQTRLEVKGGDPVIGAAITDFYTPRFRELFVNWLNSINEYPKPFEFTLGRISEILDMNTATLFITADKAMSGCFAPDADLEKDPKNHLFYYWSKRIVKEA